jgi:hypothetical protein
MQIRTKIALLAVMVLAVLPAAGNAYACDHNGTNGNTDVAAASFTMHHHGSGLFRASATYLGLTGDQLKAKLSSGQSLGQVADATAGKSAAGLVSYLTSLVKAKLDPLVASGKLTSAQESAILARVQDKLTTVVNATNVMLVSHDRHGDHQGDQDDD